VWLILESTTPSLIAGPAAASAGWGQAPQGRARLCRPPFPPQLRKRLVIAGYSHRTVTLLYIGLAAVGLLLAALWHAGGLVSDGA